MKFKCKCGDIVRRLSTVAAVADGRMDSVFGWMRVKALTCGVVYLTASNATMTVERQVTCEVSEGGEAVLAARTLAEMVGSIGGKDDEVSFDGDGKGVTISGRQCSFRCACPSSAEVQEHARPGKDAGSLSVVSGLFAAMVARSAYAASTDATRGTLRAVCFQVDNGCLDAVATNGCRLAWAEKAVETESKGGEFCLPRGMAEFVAKLAGETNTEPMFCEWDEKSAFFRSGGWTVVASISGCGPFPAWRRVVPEKRGSARCKVLRDAILEALSRMEICARASDVSKVVLTIDGDRLVLEAGSGSFVSRESIGVDRMTDMCGAKACVDVGFLRDAVKAFATDKVEIAMESQDKPITVVEVGSVIGGVAVIMQFRGV